MSELGIGDDPFQQGEAERADGGVEAAQGLYERVQREEQPVSRQRRRFDTRKISYDYLRARTEQPVPTRVAEAALMTAREAGDAMGRVHRQFNIQRAEPAFLVAFQDALLVTMALNGTSQLMPGRAHFVVGRDKFELVEVYSLLGVDLRRFARAWAEEQRDAVARAQSYVGDDPDKLDLRDRLFAKAAENGMHRHPTLLSDVADFCPTLTLVERTAVQEAKSYKLGGTVDSVDQLTLARRNLPGDGFDSTTLRPTVAV